MGEVLINNLEVVSSNTKLEEKVIRKQLRATTVLELGKICKKKGLLSSDLREILVQKILQFDESNKFT